MATVSIIVPVYNAQAYLHKCIDNLLSQSFEDFELILVNDGSKDSSGDICDEYAEKDPRIKVIHKENGGVSSARNSGLDNASGKYIMFCDSDDYINSDFCAPLVEYAQLQDDCLVFAGITTLKDSGKAEDVLCPEYSEGEYVTFSMQEFCDLYVKLNLNKPFTLMHMPYNKLFSRRIIEENHIRYNTEIHYNEDFIFNLDYLSCVDCIKLYNKSVYNYYLDAPGSLCKKYFPDIKKMFDTKARKVKEVILDKAADKAGAHRVWCTMIFNDTLRTINNTYSPSNPASDREKVRYCNSLLRSREFRKAIKNADTSEYKPSFIKLLKLGNFGLMQFIRKIH